MNTIAYNASLDSDNRLELVKNAKGGSWYDGWKPYCFATINGRWACKSPRMIQTEYGFRCSECGNIIGWNCERLEESPLNNTTVITSYKYPYPNI